MRYFITGAAGFIGFHLANSLLQAGHDVDGYDGMTPYYDPALKRARLELLLAHDRFTFTEGMLEDRERLDEAMRPGSPFIIVHLAAQAGVRYSIDHPTTYIDSNVTGTFNVLELARKHQPEHLMLASTSSAYGASDSLPFVESDPTHLPISLYAATKKAGEVMSHSYAHLFGIPTTCFRFFTVYGPWGRPDMALFKFVDRVTRGDPIEIYGEGRMSRDFTFIDDLVTAIRLLAEQPPVQGSPVSTESVSDSLSPVAPWRVVNIAGGRTVELMEFVRAVEDSMGIEARKILLPMQPGDVPMTRADPQLLHALTGYQLTTPVATGVRAFVEWYRDYFDAS